MIIIIKHDFLGRARPKNSENPKMNKLRPDSNEQFLRLEIPTPVIMPNITQNKPPTTGSGIVTKIDANFPLREKMIYFKGAFQGNMPLR